MHSTVSLSDKITLILMSNMNNSCKTLIGVHKLRGCPIKVLQLYCWPMTSFIISLSYDHSHLFGSWYSYYKNLIWLLGNGQQLIVYQHSLKVKCMLNMSCFRFVGHTVGFLGDQVSEGFASLTL